MKRGAKQDDQGLWKRGLLVSVACGAGVFFLSLLIIGGLCSGSEAVWCAAVQSQPPWLLLLVLAMTPGLLWLLNHRESLRREQLQLQKTTLQLQREDFYANSFYRSIDLLRADRQESRLGAIFSLERLAHEHLPSHWTVVETLAAFVRTHSPWWPEQAQTQDELGRAAIEIQAALTVLGRRAWIDTEKRHIDLSFADLRWLDLKQAKFANVMLEESNLAEADLTGANLRHANLIECQLSRAFLVEASLVGASLMKAQLDKSILVEADLSQADLEMANLDQAVLAKANLSNARLTLANLNSANLTRANLAAADLNRADLAFADLAGADLSHADLDHATLKYANLNNANLSNTNLYKTNLLSTNLEGANLQGATYYPTTILPIGLDPDARGMIMKEKRSVRQPGSPNLEDSSADSVDNKAQEFEEPETLVMQLPKHKSDPEEGDDLATSEYELPNPMDKQKESVGQADPRAMPESIKAESQMKPTGSEQASQGFFSKQPDQARPPVAEGVFEAMVWSKPQPRSGQDAVVQANPTADSTSDTKEDK